MLLETVTKVKAVWPANLPLTVRLSASDWTEGGWTVDDSVKLAKLLKDLGVDLIDCSSAYVRGGDHYPYGPSWQVPLAQQVKALAGIATGAVGMITEPEQANKIIEDGQADLIFIARESMREPQWPYKAALALGADIVPEAKSVLPKNYSYAL
jgi:2,4-dienoyl-CoA reductase-like NADH-dependent reductase (Old Yellow Enzyme family)